MLNPRAGMSSGFPKNDYELGEESSSHPDHIRREIFSPCPLPPRVPILKGRGREDTPARLSHGGGPFRLGRHAPRS